MGTKAEKRQKRQRAKTKKLEKQRGKLGNIESNGHATFSDVAYRVLGALKNAATSSSSYQSKGVKQRGLQQQLGSLADASQITRVLDTTERYGISSNQGSGTYNVTAEPGSDEFALLEIMLLSTKKDSSESLTSQTVARHLRTDTDTAETYLDLLAEEQGPLAKVDGHYTLSSSWR